MSFRSTIKLYELPDGGEVHVYETFDPAVLRDGQEHQRRINVRIPSICDIDEELEGTRIARPEKPQEAKKRFGRYEKVWEGPRIARPEKSQEAR